MLLPMKRPAQAFHASLDLMSRFFFFPSQRRFLASVGNQVDISTDIMRSLGLLYESSSRDFVDWRDFGEETEQAL
jgi:hypothetical protein